MAKKKKETTPAAPPQPQSLIKTVRKELTIGFEDLLSEDVQSIGSAALTNNPIITPQNTEEPATPEPNTPATALPPTTSPSLATSANLTSTDGLTEEEKTIVDKMEEFSNEIYGLVSKLNRIEALSKELDTIRDTDGLRKKLKRERETAKEYAHELIKKMKLLENERPTKDKEKEMFIKVTKQFAEVVEQFDRVYRFSVQREKHATRKQILLDDADANTRSVGKVSDDQIEQKLVCLSGADAATIEVEKQLSREMLEDLKRLETDMNDLAQMYVDVRDMLLEQQAGIDQMLTNLQNTNAHMESAVTTLREVNNMTLCTIQ